MQGIQAMRTHAFLFLLILGCFLHADVVPTNDFDVVEEDRILNGLQSGNMSAGTDPKFAVFLTDIGSRLTLPQTYDSAIHDFVLAIKNDQKWLEDQTLRRAITGLCRKITYSCTTESTHIPEVYATLGDVTAKFPIEERYRLLGFMNRLDALRQKQADLADKAQQKVDADAAKDAEKQKVADEKAAVAANVAAAKAEAVKEKTSKTPRAKTTRQKATSAKDLKDSSNDDAAGLSDEQKSVSPRKPRGRPRKAAGGAGVDVSDVEDFAPVVAPSQDRFDQPHAVLSADSGVMGGGAAAADGPSAAVQETAQN